MPTFDRVHLASCLADAVRSAVENLRDDPAVSHLTFHMVINGGEYRGDTLYSIAYGYLEDGLVPCSCGAIVQRSLVIPLGTIVRCDLNTHMREPHERTPFCANPVPEPTTTYTRS